MIEREIMDAEKSKYFGSIYSPIRAFFIFLLSSCSAEMKPRIERFMLKLDCG